MPFFTSENNPSPKEETLDFLRTFASLYNFTLWNIPNDSSSERFFLPLTGSSRNSGAFVKIRELKC
ncbi:hypothetical protein, partial [Prevotella sp. MGM2]|uniref:hypothetical protein n=1 Tax=Prevotella sp. MGM2 TaxID=2033406 RepID=UPI000D0C6238